MDFFFERLPKMSQTISVSRTISLKKGSGQFAKHYKAIDMTSNLHMTSMDDSEVYPNSLYPDRTSVKECILLETGFFNLRNESISLYSESITEADNLKEGSNAVALDPFTVERTDGQKDDKGVVMLLRIIPITGSIGANDILLKPTRCVSDKHKRSVAWQFPPDTCYKLKHNFVKVQLIAATFGDAVGLLNRDRKYKSNGYILVKRQESLSRPKATAAIGAAVLLANR
jgi:hypothetical protein